MDEIITNNRQSLLIEVENNLEKYDNRKDLNRAFAVGIRVTTSLLGAAVAVLLGWKYESKPLEWMTNLALVFGASISVMNSIDTFFSFSSRWTHYKGICTQLIFLKKDIKNELVGKETLSLYKTRLDDIITEAKKGEIEFHNKRR